MIFFTVYVFLSRFSCVCVLQTDLYFIFPFSCQNRHHRRKEANVIAKEITSLFFKGEKFWKRDFFFRWRALNSGKGAWYWNCLLVAVISNSDVTKKMEEGRCQKNYANRSHWEKNVESKKVKKWKSRESYWRGKISTVDLLLLTSSNQLLLMMK